ncbi:hypothetical protein CSQ93_22985 [Janthinobacterium sp. BJB426]|nr:hypothetical protein CSQ93_22985 [Janthinobacterium sp. BJB426]
MQDENFAICLPRFSGNKRPRFWQIAHALQAAVADASLTPGNRLPPQRRLEESGRARRAFVPNESRTYQHTYTKASCNKGFAYSSNTLASGRGAI